jgi:hypothetical protein
MTSEVSHSGEIVQMLIACIQAGGGDQDSQGEDRTRARAVIRSCADVTRDRINLYISMRTALLINGHTSSLESNHALSS